jgi:ABC-type branched-subunit amino acid transport system substrate-binding protein
MWIQAMKLRSDSIVLSVILLGIAGCFTSSTPPPIVIGHVSDATRLDKAGYQAELGIRLALHELSQDSTFAEAFGARKIEVHHTDAGGNLDKMESQAVRLDSLQRCLALFGGLSVAETGALNHAKVPLLTFHGQPAPGADNQVFYLGMSPSQQGAVLAQFVAEDAKAIQITLLMDERRAEALALAESFQKTLARVRQGKGAQPKVYLIRFGGDARWSELIDRMNAQEPHSIVFAGTVQDFNAWRKAFVREFLTSDPQVVYGGSDGDQRLFDVDGDAKSAVILASTLDLDPASAKVQAFKKSFKEAFQSEPEADVHAALAYDGFRMLADAMKRTSTQLTPERLRDELLKTKDLPGLTGALSINADRVIQRPLFVVRWQDRVVTPVKAYAP